MIQEQYVSFEVAKLLKKKGFDELCSKKYNVNKQIVFAGKQIELWQNSEFDNNEECSAPTQQMAMRWLREIYKLHIEIIIVTNFPKERYAIQIVKNCEPILLSKNNEHVQEYNTYEDAVEAAIMYCLRIL